MWLSLPLLKGLTLPQQIHVTLLASQGDLQFIPEQREKVHLRFCPSSGLFFSYIGKIPYLPICFSTYEKNC